MIKTKLIILFFYCSFAFADSRAFLSSTIALSNNSKYAYVYLEKGTNIKHVAQNKDNKQISEYEFNEKNYPKNGMYEIATRKFLWTLQKNKEINRTFNGHPLNDGVHIVLFGPWASSIDDEAFSFYKRNRLIKKFKIKDFCSDPTKFFHTTSHFMWKQNLTINDSNKTISFNSCGNQFVLDVTTGKVLK